MALELGKPLLVHDEDYDTEYPEPAEEEQIKSNGEHSTEQFTPLSTIVRVVRSFQSLVELRKSSYIPRETLLSREDYLCTFFSSFPKTFQPSSSGFLDPRAIGPLVCLQNARLLLQRHNLTPACPSELRLEAIDNCVMVARDTATILSRCLDPSLSPKQAPAERSRVLATSASTLLCMHVWRCLLFLLFRRHYHPALVLVQAASAIGGARPVNLCCGRHVEFFLRLLYSRRQQGHSADLDEDEEMIAYVSGDLQSDPYASWVWQARDSGIDLRNLAKTVPGLPSFDQVRSGLTNNVKHTALTDPERKEWSGWEKVEREIRFLHEQQQIQQQQLPSRLSQQQAPSSSPSDTSRMTIANII